MKYINKITIVQSLIPKVVIEFKDTTVTDYLLTEEIQLNEVSTYFDIMTQQWKTLDPDMQLFPGWYYDPVGWTENGNTFPAIVTALSNQNQVVPAGKQETTFTYNGGSFVGRGLQSLYNCTVVPELIPDTVAYYIRPYLVYFTVPHAGSTFLEDIYDWTGKGTSFVQVSYKKTGLNFEVWMNVLGSFPAINISAIA